jgi:hydrogenase maturation protease
MGGSVLIAGIGNIFQGDDFFGVAVIHRLAALRLPDNVRVIDIGIRSLDLGFALLDNYDVTILVDTVSRGGAPGTLYTIEIAPDDIPESHDEISMVNSHGLDVARVLALAKSMGAQFESVLLVGCEPLILDHDDTGHIGLSESVEAAIAPAVETIRKLVENFTGSAQGTVPAPPSREELIRPLGGACQPVTVVRVPRE